MSVRNRREVRDALATLLDTALTSAELVYPLTNADGERITQPPDFGGESPVVVVASSGTERTQLTFGGQLPRVYLDIYTFVRADALAPDDLLDDLEQQLGQAITNAQSSTYWTAIDYDGRSQTEFITTLHGTEYKREKTTLKITARL